MSAEHRDALLSALPACNLPSELVAWLTQGFAAWQQGQSLEQALELEAPDLDERDDMIRTVIELSPGESVAARCSYFIGCLDGCELHHRHDMQQQVERLRGLSVPRSLKQLRRILDGRRQDGWRIEGT
jgi:hypothetical protein